MWSNTCVDSVDNKVVTIQGFECIVKIILNYAIRFAGIAIFIMFLIGGFQYLTSGGDPKATQSAKNVLTYAVFGLVFILLGWFALRFIQVFTGAPVTNFTI